MVEVELKPSQIHGLGVFLKEHVRKGQLIWTHNDAVDHVFEDDELAVLSNAFLKHLSHYGYRRIEDGKWLLNSDLAKFTNHSDTPSSVVADDGNCYAAFDMPTGTEITENYTTFAIGGCVQFIKE